MPWRARVALLSLLGVTLSCRGDATTSPAPRDAGHTYWALQLNHDALNMATVAPANTFRLVATPVNALGAPLPGAGAVTYSNTDSTVTVDSTGLVTARYATAGTFVVVSSQQQNVTLVDTVRIQVTDTIPQHALATFTMQPLGSDSAKRSLDFNTSNFWPSPGGYTWPVRATDGQGTTVCDSTACALKVHYTSSNPLVARIDPVTGHVTALDTGHTVFTATTVAYGVAWQDSVRFTVGYQLSYTVGMVLSVILGVLTLGFVAPKKLILGVGAVVTFCNEAPRPVDVRFDLPPGVDSTSVDSASCVIQGTPIPGPHGIGNIPAFGGNYVVPLQPQDTLDCTARRFTKPGLYRYHSTLFPSDTFEISIQKD